MLFPGSSPCSAATDSGSESVSESRAATCAAAVSACTFIEPASDTSVAVSTEYAVGGIDTAGDSDTDPVAAGRAEKAPLHQTGATELIGRAAWRFGAGC
jgi:hypothetical protein